MISINFLLALSSLAVFSLAENTKEAVEHVEEGPVFHPRGVQTFKSHSDLPFRFLSVQKTDRTTVDDDSWFEFGKLESMHVSTIKKADGEELNYLNVNRTVSPVMRLYFNPGANRVASLSIKVLLGYMNKGNHTTQYLSFPKKEDHLLCPKTVRFEFGSCHYHRNQSTFEQITLPIGEWPEEAKGEDRFCTVTLILHEGDRDVLGAAFYALYL